MARARTLLVCEISEVTGESKSVVEEQITDALHLGKTGLSRDLKLAPISSRRATQKD